MTGKLVEALARTGYVAVSKVALRSRERLALLGPRGHRSEETTREIYLEPLRGLQVETLLSDETPENTEVLSRLARRTELVLDAPVMEWS